MSSPRRYDDPCGVARSLDVVGERWALLVVRELLLGPKRFADLRAGLPAMSPNVLSQRLRDLEEGGVLSRRILEPPARVQVYELTDWGRDLEPVLLHLGRWGGQPPAPDGRLSVASMMLSLKAGFDAKAPDGTYELRIGAEPYTAEVASGELELRRGRAEKPAAIATTDAETLSAILLGRTSTADALRSGTLTLDGSKTAVRRLTVLLRTS